MTRRTVFQPPDPIALVGVVQAGKQLGIDRSGALEIFRSGLPGDHYQAGKQVFAQQKEVDKLADTSLITIDDQEAGDLPTALVVRVNAAVPDSLESGRSFMGWNSALTKKQQLDGVRAFWLVSDPEELTGELFIATISGFPVVVARISGHNKVGRLLSFKLTAADKDDEDATFYATRRLETRKGGNTLRIGPPKTGTE